MTGRLIHLTKPRAAPTVGSAVGPPLPRPEGLRLAFSWTRRRRSEALPWRMLWRRMRRVAPRQAAFYRLGLFGFQVASEIESWAGAALLLDANLPCVDL